MYVSLEHVELREREGDTPLHTTGKHEVNFEERQS